MSVTIELTKSMEDELESRAAANGQAPSELARDVLQNHLVHEALNKLKHTDPVKSLQGLQSRRQIPVGSTSVREIVGKWPGDETDEEIAAALEELS